MRVTVPTSWRHITIKQYNEYRLLCARKLLAVEHIAHSISILCELELKKVYAMPISELQRIYGLMQFLTVLPDKPKKIKLIRVGLFLYKVIDPAKASFGQYITTKEHSKPDYIDEYLHRVLACYMVRVGYKWTEKEYEYNAKYFYEHMNVEVAYSLALFFWTYYNELSKIILDYSFNKVRESLSSTIATLRSNGDGG
jgi:hypothetical protein